MGFSQNCITFSIKCISAMKKKKQKTKTKETKKATLPIGKGKERKRTLFYCEVF